MDTSHRARVFWPLLTTWVVADFVSKRLVEGRLTPHVENTIIGDWVRFTLTYNTGAAMNISLGGASRVVFTALALGMIVVIFMMYRHTQPNETAQPIALALIAGGALGNLVDRLRSAKGVVDFIDVGIGDLRFWTFNVADAGVTCGAILLVILMWRRGDRPSTSQ
jgi:signal peptidase II